MRVKVTNLHQDKIELMLKEFDKTIIGFGQTVELEASGDKLQRLKNTPYFQVEEIGEPL